MLNPDPTSEVVYCVSAGHEDIRAAEVGTYFAGDERFPDTAYCRDCVRLLSPGEFVPYAELSPESDAELSRLRGEVARLQSERDALELNRNYWHGDADAASAEVRELRAEVTAAKADALEQAAEYFETHHGDEMASHWDEDIAAYLRMLARAADTRAELGDS